MRDELLRRALQDINRLNNDPAYRALMDHHDQMRRNPAYQAVLEESNRRSQDPAYRALIESVAAVNQNPAYRALIEFENNRRHYKEMSALTQDNHIDRNIFHHTTDLRANLLRNNAELWINTEILQSGAKFKQFEESLRPPADVTFVRSVEIPGIESENQSKKQQSDTAIVVEKFNEDYAIAERDLSEDERLSMFVVVSKNKYKIKSLVAEERSNRIKVFLDSGDDGLFVFFSPFELHVLFGKEKISSHKVQKRVGFLSYKRGTNGKDEVRIISSRRKMNMKQLSIIRVVVASPGDVMPERNALEEAINEINEGIARGYGIRLELARWETDAYPGFHLDGAQGLIDPILNIEECDVFIGIFWKRFGTPTMHAKSGTEHEFLKAYDAWQMQGSPHIMFYFNQKPYTPTSTEELQQWGQVLEFKNNFPKEGLWWAYNGEIEFEKQLRRHLTKFLVDYMAKDAGVAEDDGNDESEDQEIVPEILYSDSSNLDADTHQTFPCRMEEGSSINYEIESDQPVDIMVMRKKHYRTWLEQGEIDRYYEISMVRTKLRCDSRVIP